MWLKKEIKKHENSEEFILEGKIIEITEKICLRLKELNWSKKKLAIKMNTSQAWITKMLNGNNNFTLRTLIKLSTILNLCLEIDLVSKNKYLSTRSISDYITIETDPKLFSSYQKENLIYSTTKNDFTKSENISGFGL